MLFLSQAVDFLANEVYAIRGVSMMPALLPADRLLVRRRAYREALPARGDIVVLDAPGRVGRPYVKRVVGLPGEEVRMSEGMLFVDGARLSEPYLAGLPASPGMGRASWRLRRDEYFVLGDNRAHSTDSREFGPVRIGHMVGRVWFRFWPPARWRAPC